MDRNQKARDEFQIRRARKQIADGVASGTTGLRDRFGHLLTAGANVIYLPPATGLVYTVIDVKPVLDPGAPPGVVAVTLSTTALFKAGITQEGMLRLSEGEAETSPEQDEADRAAAAAFDQHVHDEAAAADVAESAIKLTDQ